MTETLEQLCDRVLRESEELIADMRSWPELTPAERRLMEDLDAANKAYRASKGNYARPLVRLLRNSAP